MEIKESCVDDLLYESLCVLNGKGIESRPREKKTLELLNVNLVLTNPRSRLFLSPHRILNPFELVGRLIWELSGDDNLDSIQYYSRGASNFATDGKINTAYGKRIFGEMGIFGKRFIDSPYTRLLDILLKDSFSRRKIKLILHPEDCYDTTYEYPCIVGLHFFIRDGKLDLVVYARSESAFRILPMDIFMFTMIQELTAVKLGLILGTYYHHIGSFHYYIESDQIQINNFLCDRFNIPKYSMDPLIGLDMWKELIELEHDLRTSTCISNFSISNIDSTETQFALLLLIYRKFVKEEIDDKFYYYLNYLNDIYRNLAMNYLHFRGMKIDLEKWNENKSKKK